MTLMRRFKSDIKVCNTMKSLCNFSKAVGELAEMNIHSDPKTASPSVILQKQNLLNVIKTYIHKAEMHGVLNIWPFNVIKLVDSKNLTTESIDEQFKFLTKNRKVTMFIESFNKYIDLLKEEFVLLKKKNHYESLALNRLEWWRWHNEESINRAEIESFNILDELTELRESITGVEHYLESILVDVHLDMAAIMVNEERPLKISTKVL